jgi:hypothetical protein
MQVLVVASRTDLTEIDRLAEIGHGQRSLALVEPLTGLCPPVEQYLGSLRVLPGLWKN